MSPSGDAQASVQQSSDVPGANVPGELRGSSMTFSDKSSKLHSSASSAAQIHPESRGGASTPPPSCLREEGHIVKSAIGDAVRWFSESTVVCTERNSL